MDDSPIGSEISGKQRVTAVREIHGNRAMYLRALSARGGVHCSFPECEIDISEALEICHIHAANAAGPRYDSFYKDVGAIDNVSTNCQAP